MGKRGKRRKRGYWSEEEQRFIRKKKRRGGRGRMSYAKRNFQERAGWQNRHHMLAKSRHGSWSEKNILMMDERRHSAYHLIFSLMTFLEAAELLVRCHCMKNKLNHKEEFGKIIAKHQVALAQSEWNREGLS
jgi:hypothetical protein